MDAQFEKINSLVIRLERHQGALGLNDTQFVVRYQRYLGSAKTWRDRLIGRQFKELGKALPKWERKLEALVAEIDGRSPVIEYFPEMPLCRQMTEFYHRLQETKTDRRCAVALASTGVGKSAWARHIVSKYPRETVYVRANEPWRDSKGEIIKGIGRAIGLNLDSVYSTGGRLGKLIDTLKLNPQTVIIDEAHEGGVLLMKLVKTLIDETSSKFILLAYPTTWRRVMAATDDSRSEAQQLFGRTLKPIFDAYKAGVDQQSVAVFLKHAAGFEDDVLSIAAKILPMIRSNGNLRILADAIEGAQIQSDVEDKPLDGELLIDHLALLCPVSPVSALEKGGK